MNPRDPRDEERLLRDAVASVEIATAGLVGKPPAIDDLDDLVVIFSNERVAATLDGVRSVSRVREILDVWQALWRETAPISVTL